VIDIVVFSPLEESVVAAAEVLELVAVGASISAEGAIGL
jgi:hypothetical protein